MERIITKITEALSPIPCVRAVVLGGSRATLTHDTASDVDIGVYYDADTLNLPALNAAAKALDDAHRSGLIGPPGSWGRWVNCGGWLSVGGVKTDVILRDLGSVRHCIAQTDSGEITLHYQTGHPHMFSNVIYRGELALSRTLYAADEDFAALKAHARAYPDALQSALIGAFLFEAGFSCDLAKKALDALDLYALSGHLFRAVSALNQTIFALNRTYCLNEKKALARIAGMTLTPHKYKSRVEKLLSCPASPEAIHALLTLLEDTRQLLEQADR